MPEKPGRRWFAFRLRTLLNVLLWLAIVAALAAIELSFESFPGHEVGPVAPRNVKAWQRYATIDPATQTFRHNRHASSFDGPCAAC
jgi:hypothetical protein